MRWKCRGQCKYEKSHLFGSIWRLMWKNYIKNVQIFPQIFIFLGWFFSIYRIVVSTISQSTRVDVSETVSANQLWFRILSGLFQRCSLPENLWTALIQLWTALKTEIIGPEIQRWNSADFLWNSTDSELNSADFLWNSSEERWFLNNSEWRFLVTFSLFSKCF